MAQGDAGQALLAAHLTAAFPDEPWDVVAYDFLGTAVEQGRRHGAPVSAAAGLSGLSYVLQVVDTERRWSAAGQELGRLVNQQSLALVAELNQARQGSGRVSPSMFDVISGLSGVALTLLPLAPSDPGGAALPFVVRALSDLALSQVPTAYGVPCESPLPAWYTPAKLLYDDEQRHQYPWGNLNCGLAHGIPGLLAALALSALAGRASDLVIEAITAVGDWLMRNQAPADGGPRWPIAIAVQSYGRPEGTDPGRTPTRDAWCYGSPGVARALYLAGVAVDRPDWRDAAVASLEAVYRRPVDERAIDSPTFCHGVAGLLQITMLLARDTGLPVFTRAAEQLLDQILDTVDPDLPLGVANQEPGGVLVDQPGLLDGATGVCLVLLSAAGTTQPSGSWDRLLALS